MTAADVARVGERLLAPKACVAAVLGPKAALKAGERFQRAMLAG